MQLIRTVLPRKVVLAPYALQMVDFLQVDVALCSIVTRLQRWKRLVELSEVRTPRFYVEALELLGAGPLDLLLLHVCEVLVVRVVGVGVTCEVLAPVDARSLLLNAELLRLPFSRRDHVFPVATFSISPALLFDHVAQMIGHFSSPWAGVLLGVQARIENDPTLRVGESRLLRKAMKSKI